MIVWWDFFAEVVIGVCFINFEKVGRDLFGKVSFEGGSFGVIGRDEEEGDREICERENAISGELWTVDEPRKFRVLTI